MKLCKSNFFYLLISCFFLSTLSLSADEYLYALITREEWRMGLEKGKVISMYERGVTVFNEEQAKKKLSKLIIKSKVLLTLTSSDLQDKLFYDYASRNMEAFVMEIPLSSVANFKEVDPAESFATITYLERTSNYKYIWVHVKPDLYFTGSFLLRYTSSWQLEDIVFYNKENHHLVNVTRGNSILIEKIHGPSFG